MSGGAKPAVEPVKNRAPYMAPLQRGVHESPTPLAALAAAFATARQTHRAALGGYFPVGFPTFAQSCDVLVGLASHCDFVEVGVPCEAPTMDGKPIVSAMAQSIRQGFRMADFFTAVREVSPIAPVVAMSYWNPIKQYGAERFAADLASAGAAGVILPDLPVTEAESWRSIARAHGLATVLVLLGHDTSEAELDRLCADADGFIYVAASDAPTGGQGPLRSTLSEFVARVRAHTSLPVCTGIGVAGASQATESAAYADGVIVGSAFVRCLLSEPSPVGAKAARVLASDLAAATQRRPREEASLRSQERAAWWS